MIKGTNVCWAPGTPINGNIIPPTDTAVPGYASGPIYSTSDCPNTTTDTTSTDAPKKSNGVCSASGDCNTDGQVCTSSTDC